MYCLVETPQTLCYCMPLTLLTDCPLPPSLPHLCTVQWLVTHYFDIQSIPRRSFFEFLAHFASTELEKEKLTEFTTPEGQVALHCTLVLCKHKVYIGICSSVLVRKLLMRCSTVFPTSCSWYTWCMHTD